MKNIIIGAIAVVALVLSGFNALHSSQSGMQPAGATSAAGMLAENYWPYLLYNGGYNSAKDISTTANLYTAALTTTGASTLGGTVTVTTTNAATSTLTVGCVQTYATSTATPIRWSMDLFSTTTAKNQNGATVNGLVTWGFGSCPF